MRKFLLLFLLVIGSASIKAERLFWVGGSGNFSDAAHWSYVSGGSGGAKTPDHTDDVNFDQYSFKNSSSVVTISGEINVRDFTIYNEAKLFTIVGANEGKAFIHGNYKLTKRVDWKYNGLIEFVGKGDISIDFNYHILNGNVSFNSSDGNFTLKSDLVLKDDGVVFLNKGSLNIKKYSLIAGSLLKQSKSAFQLNLDEALVKIVDELSCDDKLNVTSNKSQLEYFSDKHNNELVANSVLRTIGKRDLTILSITDVTIIDSCTCPGECNGSMQVTFNGPGTPPYDMTFSEDGNVTTFTGIPSSPFIATGLCGGNYTIRVFNSAGIQIGSIANIYLFAPSDIAINFNDYTFPICNGACTGEVKFDIIGGNPKYSAVWTPPGTTFPNLNQGQEIAVQNLCAGLHHINVTDRKGCLYNDSINITEPTPILPNDTKIDQSCFGFCTGLAAIDPNGGTPFGAVQTNGIFYNVMWEGNPLLTNDSITSLCPGVYSFTITDGNSCTKTDSLTINSVTDFTYTKSATDSLTCFGIPDGNVSITNVSGATPIPGYTYTWLGPTAPTVMNTPGGAPVNSFASGMSAGTYSVIIADANGCDDTTTFVIIEPPELIGSVSTTSVSCNGGNDGTATASHIGGTGLVTYKWLRPGPVQIGNLVSVSGLSANITYSLVVTDSKGCDDTVNFSVIEPLPLVINATASNPACFGSTIGQVCGSYVSGGTGAIASYSFAPAGGTPAANCYTNIPIGTYTVTGTDGNGCTAIATATLTSPTQIFPNLTYTDPTCNAACNGTAAVSPTGGNGGPYSFSWSCAPAATDSFINGQCVGTCTVTVSDVLGCTASDSLTFVEPTALNLSLVHTNVNCFGAATAFVSSTVSGGTPFLTGTYNYFWTPTGSTSPNLSNVGAGSHVLVVTDANGCTIRDSALITSPPPIVMTEVHTNPSCSGFCDGSINSSVAGGTPPYAVVSWNPFVSLSLTATNLCAGSYTLIVRDAFGCRQSDTIVLTDPLGISVSTDTTQTLCINGCNGTATANASGGVGGYIYSWNTVPVQNTQTATGLCDGNYIVNVVDGNGCPTSATAVITEPTAVSITVIMLTPSCENICNGTATISSSGGTGAHTYVLDGSPIGGSTSLGALCAGTHTVVAIDANGCSAQTVFDIPVLLSVTTSASATNLVCAGDCNATATVNVTGATNPTYLWTPTNQSTQTAVGLCAGTHVVTITDVNGCIVDDTVTFVNPPVFTAPVSATPVDCNGNCTGSATVNPAGGAAPYSVSWSDGGLGLINTNLCVGSYTATITDDNGCSIQQTATITQPAAYSLDSLFTPPSTCGGNDGSYTVIPSGANGGYTYSWAPAGFPGGSTDTYSSLTSGAYTVTITDSKGCDTTKTYGLSDPGGPVTTGASSNISCPGFCDGVVTVDVISSSGPTLITFPTPPGTTGPAPLTVNGLCANTYVVEVADTTACLSYQTVIITQPPVFLHNPVIADVSCNGLNDGSIVLSPTGGTRPYSYQINTIADDSSMTGLTAGVYTITITDANGCNYTFNDTVRQPTAITVSEAHTAINCTSGFGTATITVNGGTPAYSYIWSDINVAPISSVSLDTGSFTCTVTDANGCAASVSLTITENPPLLSGFVSVNNLCASSCTGTADFNTSGGAGVGTYTYSWSHDGSLSTSGANSLCPGTYTATVSDNNGCSVTESYTITAPPVLTASVVVANPLCNNGSDGSITVTANGGTPDAGGGYNYTWTPGVSATSTAGNLSAGSYTVNVIDDNGCVVQLIRTLTEPTPLLANINSIDPSCFGSCDGVLYSAPTGGVSPYTHSWGPAPAGGSNDSVTGLCAGTYYGIVIDGNGCRDSASFVFSDPDQLTLTYTSTLATCGLIPCDGSLTITSTTGDSLNWLSSTPPGYTGLTQDSLCAGVYPIVIYDSNGCSDTVQAAVSNANGPVVNVDSTNTKCINSCDGSATVVSAVGPNPPFTYSWALPIPATNTTPTASNLCAGTYLSIVKDAMLCSTITPITVNQPGTLNDNEIITPASCSGISNGSITLAPTGGTPYTVGAPYHYQWSPAVAGDTPTANGLTPGTYSVTVIDSNLCQTVFTYVLGTGPSIQHQLLATDASCFSQCNGIAQVGSITGGTAPFNIVWSDGQSGTIANALCAGNYTVTITDNVGCIIIDSIDVSEPSALIANATVTSTACGACNGSVALAPSGGTGAFSYEWSGGQTTATASNLCAGVHMVNVTDAAGCVVQFSVAVNNSTGATFTTNSTNVNCAGQCTGTASATVTSGTAPYQYNWVGLGQTTSAVSNLCAGTYFVQVKDGDNCLISDTIIIAENTTLLVDAAITPTTCGACTGSTSLSPSGGLAPYTYAWSAPLSPNSSQNNLCAGSYSVVVTDNAGCKDTSFVNINSTNGPLISVATDSTFCNGSSDGAATVTIVGTNTPYTVTWSNGSNANPTETGLDAGIHSVVVSDVSGCSTVKTFEIYEPNAISLSLSNTQLSTCQAACNGAMTALPSGGTMPYSYLWSPGNLTTNSISNQCAGLYNLVVTDPNGCTVSQNIQLLNSPNPFNVAASIIYPACGVCNGSSSLALSGGLAPYTFGWSNDSTNTGFASANLCAGVYMVVISDALGCTQQYNLDIDNANGPDVTVTTTDVACEGQYTGTATATVSGGTTPYQYNWIGVVPFPQTGSSVSNLGAGSSYFVQVKDANNCETNEPFTINETTVLFANPSVSSNNCGVCNGAITLSPTGGTLPYTYSWSGGLPAIPNPTNLCANTYTAIVTDNSGCSDTTVIGLSSTSAPFVTIDIDSVSCFGLSDGSATLTISGGVPGYTVLWSNGSIADPTESNFPAGTHSVRVTDNAGCVFAQAFDVEEPMPLSLSLSNTQLPNCAGFCNGALAAIPSGGTLNYTYLWSNGITTDTMSNLCPGTFTLTVTDGNGCAKTQTTVLIENPVPFNIDTVMTLPGCNLCNGAIDLTMLSGMPPFTFSWSTSPNDTLEDVLNICAGNLSVSIVDSAGCAQTIPFTISNVNGITGDSVSVVNETCFGTCDGTALVTPIGGTPPYTYLWQPIGDTTNFVANLCVGSYSITITDSNNCVRITQADILSPNQMTATTVIDQPNCSVQDGSITLNVNGGAAPLTYSWNPPTVPGNTNSSTNLGAGSYTITVTDNTPCVQSFTVNLSDVGGPMVNVLDTSVSCYGLCDGKITLDITSVNPSNVLWNNLTTDTFLLNLCPGNYSATITDPILGCSTVISTSITEPDSLGIGTFTAVDMSCFGLCNGIANVAPFGGTLQYSYAWTPVAGISSSIDSLCAGTYTVTVTDANGCVVTQNVIISEPTIITASGNVIDASCSSVANASIDVSVSGGNPGYTYQWITGSAATTQDLTNILYGNYTLVVTDTTLCQDTVQFNVATTDSVLANAGNDMVFCYSNNLILDGSASFVNTPSPTYQWIELPSGDTVGTTANVSVTPIAGITNYVLVISNAVGCADSDTVVITANPLPLANAGPDIEIDLDQTSVIGGNPTAPAGTTLIWSPDFLLSDDSIPNPVSSATLTTTYVVMVTDTATGCVARDSMVLTIIPPIIIPNGISPNGDGKNDFWIIDLITKFPNNEVEVYNRWGELLYAKTAYDNTWDGSYKGKPLPIGTYYYVVKLNDEDYPEPYTGPITIFK